MKPEPLKNKIGHMVGFPDGNRSLKIEPCKCGVWCKTLDLESAVEWLKQEKCVGRTSRKCITVNKDALNKCSECIKIDEAFPDLKSKEELE